MAGPLKLKVKDANGKCCCTVGACQIWCSTRGGTAMMCGEAEFGTPSVPGRFYRRVAGTGNTYYSIGFNTCECTVRNFAFKVTGASQISKDDCSQTSTMTAEWSDINELGCSPSYIPHVTGITNLGGIITAFPGSIKVQPCMTYPSTTAAKMKARNGGTSPACNVEPTCVQDTFDSGSGLWFYRIYGDDELTVTMTDEDSELDAIKRIPGVSDPFPSYTSCTVPCCRTAYQLRTDSGRFFEYLEAQYQVRGSGLPHNTALIATVQIQRRTYNVGSWADYQTVMLDVMSDDAGNASVDGGLLPNDEGYETRISSCNLAYGSL